MTRSVTNHLRGLLEGDPDPAKLEQALRHLAKWRVRLIENTLSARAGSKILSGPFRGMTYPVFASEGSRAARHLGAYEASLHPVIEEAFARGYGQVIDIGCAEGYYAVGFARKVPGLRVYAYDTDPTAQASCRALAQANGVEDRVIVAGQFAHADFALCARTKTLVICDIEGAEERLLDPSLAPDLKSADLLVEAHDCFRAGMSDLLIERFSGTHTISKMGRIIAGQALPAWTEEWGDLDRLLALWEWRIGPTPWLWMVAR